MSESNDGCVECMVRAVQSCVTEAGREFEPGFGSTPARKRNASISYVHDYEARHDTVAAKKAKLFLKLTLPFYGGFCPKQKQMNPPNVCRCPVRRTWRSFR